MAGQIPVQAVVVSSASLSNSSQPIQLALFKTDGTPKVIANQAAAQVDTVAADLAAMKVDFNALLAKLRTAGVLLP